MRTWILPLILAAAAAAQSRVEGTWLGALDTGAVKLRIGLHIDRSPDGSLTGTMDSLDQGARGIRMANIRVDDSGLRFEVPQVAGAYEGRFEDGRIDGVWRQGTAALKLVFSRVDKLPDYERPQEPKRPFPYTEEQVAYENQAGGVKLAATLTLPRGAGPFPAVVLITGSGPQDRDESLAGHRPFLVLSDYLTRRGFAVLRADDRGVGGSSGSNSASTTMDFAGDALAGVAFLKTRKEIDARRIGLVGHSEGGLIAPIAANRSTDVAFIVMMAGPGVNGEKVLLLQGELISKAMGVAPEYAQRNRMLVELALKVLREEKDNAAAAKRLHEEIGRKLASYPAGERDTMKPLVGALEAQLKLMATPWFRSFIDYDPRGALVKLRVPVLAMNGELDLQVPPQQNLPAIAEALEAGGNRDYAIVKLPRLNHLFQTAKTGSPAEYGSIEETMAPGALDLIGDWIARHVK